MVKGLLELPQKLNLQFVVADPTKSWKVFKQHFSLIQAAGGRVTNSKGQMLWIKRLGVWDLPKGKIEQGETVELAAVREVEEECGIGKLKITAPLSTTYHMYKLKEEIILKETFWFEMETADDAGLIPQEEEDIEAAVWVEPNDLANKLSDTYPSISSLFNS